MIRKSLLILLALAVAAPLFAQFQSPAPSPRGVVTQRVGITDVTITYSRPGVKDRVIWGELVPFDKVWRTGANASTMIEFGDDVMINGNELKAGTYSIHTIPTADEWTIIFNTEADPDSGWNYDETKDVLKIKAKPVAHGGFVERMTFLFPEVGNDSATVALVWEKLMVSFELSVATKELVMESARMTLDSWVPTYQAANYAFNNDMNEEATKWLDRSLNISETYFNLSLKARMAEKQDRKADAIKTAKRAIEIGKENGNNTTQMEGLVERLSK